MEDFTPVGYHGASDDATVFVETEAERAFYFPHAASE